MEYLIKAKVVTKYENHFKMMDITRTLVRNHRDMQFCVDDLDEDLEYGDYFTFKWDKKTGTFTPLHRGIVVVHTGKYGEYRETIYC